MKKSELKLTTANLKKKLMNKTRLWCEHHRLNMKTARYYSFEVKRLIQ